MARLQASGFSKNVRRRAPEGRASSTGLSSPARGGWMKPETHAAHSILLDSAFVDFPGWNSRSGGRMTRRDRSNKG